MTNEWNAGHDIIKGYPFDSIKSKDFFQNRVDVGIADNGKPYISIDKEAFPDCPAFTNDLTDQETFLLNRAVEFKKALDVAEDQILSILEERPFIPEELNFELIHKNREITEPPIRIYGPKYDPDFSIYRKPGSVNDMSWDPSIWTIIMNKDGVTKEIELCLPCRRVAYAVFSAFGIKMLPIEHEAAIAPIREESPAEQ